MKRETILEAVAERDIDLLLLEEFHCSQEFKRFFLKATIGESSPVRFLKAVHSIKDSKYGESDIEVDFQKKGSIIRFLIENKIDAELQPNQPERYKQRALKYMNSQEVNEAKTVLIAPEKYIAQDIKSRFDYSISYETVQKWFKKSDRPRGIYKSKIVKEAIDQARRGYNPIISRNVTEFWQRYWHFVQATAPELEMKEPKEKPAGSSFIEFKPALLPESVRIVHKLEHGNLDLEFKDQATHLLDIKKVFEDKLKINMVLTRAGKSAAIQIKVPKISAQKDFTSQEKAVLEGIIAAKELFIMVSSNCEEITNYQEKKKQK